MVGRRVADLLRLERDVKTGDAVRFCWPIVMERLDELTAVIFRKYATCNC